MFAKLNLNIKKDTNDKNKINKITNKKNNPQMKKSQFKLSQDVIIGSGGIALEGEEEIQQDDQSLFHIVSIDKLTEENKRIGEEKNKNIISLLDNKRVYNEKLVEKFITNLLRPFDWYDNSKMEAIHSSLPFTNQEIFDLSTVEIGRPSYCNLQDMSGWFAGRSKTKKIILPEKCYLGYAPNMGSMFKDCASLQEIVWNNLDTTDVRDMSRMFMNCKKYKELDLTLLSSDDLTNMEHMFDGCEELETIYISKDFDVSDVTKSDNAFNNCYKLVGGSGTNEALPS